MNNEEDDMDKVTGDTSVIPSTIGIDSSYAFSMEMSSGKDGEGENHNTNNDKTYNEGNGSHNREQIGLSTVAWI